MPLFNQVRIDPPEIDLDAMRRYRLARLRQELVARDIPVCILLSPIGLRYAVDFREYPLFQSHIPMFYLFVAAQGPVVMHGASHQSCSLVDEYRPSVGFNPFDSGFELGKSAAQFAQDVKNFLCDLGVHDNAPSVAIEAMPADVFGALKSRRFNLVNADPLLEQARSIKSGQEIECMKHSIAVAELGIRQMREALIPGITENQMWSILHQVNIAHDGDWMEGRMLASGPRTNPWLQEASDRVIQDGELVAFDTDMVGPFGYCADISRTWLCGKKKPTPAQQELYRHAYEEVQHNTLQIQPGMRFSELIRRIYPRAEEFIAHRYPCVFHGVGMSDEYPKLYYPEDSDRHYEGMIKPDMVLCVESFTGSVQGGEGVKLEQMVRVTEDGTELLSSYPYETQLI
ncbi:MAG: M24 family metallopeptidase [bacterium]